MKDRVAEKLDVDGYRLLSRKDGIVISLPDKRQVRIADDEVVLVINEEPKYVVRDGKDVISCIRDYSRKNDMLKFSVHDITQNRKIRNKTGEVVADHHLMFLTMARYVSRP